MANQRLMLGPDNPKALFLVQSMSVPLPQAYRTMPTLCELLALAENHKRTQVSVLTAAFWHSTFEAFTRFLAATNFMHDQKGVDPAAGLSGYLLNGSAEAGRFEAANACFGVMCL